MKTLGPVRADLLTVSKFTLDGGAMFGVVPRPLWEKKYPPDEKGGIELVARALVLRFESLGRIVVVDAGLGKNWKTVELSRHNIDLKVPSIAQALSSIGISRDEVTDAVITHLHFDHAGGWTQRGDSGEMEPVFKNATHHVQKKQWAWAQNPSVRDKGSYYRENFDCLGELGLLNMLDGSGEIMNGLEVIALDGHTPGLQIPLISGQNRKLAFLADLVPTLAHSRIAWIMAYDLFPLTTVDEKERILSRAADEEWVVVLEHEPKIQAATVTRDSAEYVLVPCALPQVL